MKLKGLSDEGEQKNLHYQMALSKWILVLHNDRSASIQWPNDDDIDFYVKQNLNAAEDWAQRPVQVMRFYCKS